MSTFKERVINEKEQLSDNIDKLEHFIGGDNFTTMHPAQQSLLKIQLAAMVTYNQCLAQRLHWLEIAG